MNWDRVGGNWKQLKGIIRQLWGRLTGDYVRVLAGKREHLVGEIQAADGNTREVNEKQLAEWAARQHKTDPIHK
jgi:uncharacterized protein YjbJ (UPF0337 family)